MRIAFSSFAQLCAAALIGACNAGTEHGDNTSMGGTGGSFAPAGAMTTGSGGAAPGANTGSGGNSVMPATGTGGMGNTGKPTGTGGTPGMHDSTAGEGSDPGSGGTVATNPDGGIPPDGGGMPEPAHEDLGKGDGSDVVTIGDSWMSLLIAGIEPSLDKASGQTYRHYAVPGTLVLNEQIPDQYEQAKMQNPDIKTVVMTGGGNDILTSSCADEACNSIVDDVSDRLAMLMVEMSADGVQDVVLIGYTYPDDMTKRESLDYSRMLSGMSCDPDVSPHCHYLDSTMLDITLRDGIHPDDAGYDLIGETVWQMMQDQGMRR